MFAVLDGVQEAAVVINDVGVVQFVNKHTEKLLGLTGDVVGRNVKQLMPEPYASAHDGYLHNYITAGQPKVLRPPLQLSSPTHVTVQIIGKGGRIVVAMHANGALVPARLEVDECILQGQRYFVGLLQPQAAVCGTDTERDGPSAQPSRVGGDVSLTLLVAAGGGCGGD